MLADEGPTHREDPLVSSREVPDQNIEMRDVPNSAPGRGLGFAADALERKPLAMRRWLQRDPSGIPLDWRAAQQPGPEGSQAPRIRAVQHDLAYPADRAIVCIAHKPMMNAFRQAACEERPGLCRIRVGLRGTAGVTLAAGAGMPRLEYWLAKTAAGQ